MHEKDAREVVTMENRKLQLVHWNKTSSKPIMRDIRQSLEMGIKYYSHSGFTHCEEITPVAAMQMQSHTQADICTGFLPNV